MALVRTRIFSIVDDEFDRVFDGSLAIMTDPTTGTYPFAELGLTTYDTQKAHIRKMCQRQIDEPNAFCFKTEDNGLLLTMVFGTAANSQLEMYYWLGADDADGSRSYVYDKANVLSFHTWLKEQGITTIRSHINEKGTRLRDFTDDGATRIQAEAGDWGISEIDPYDGVDSPSGQESRNFRKLTMNSNANITIDSD
jgi:hypothetical protein